MDIIESIKKDKAYLKCKLIVKTWEKEFKTKHSRTPSKFDIKEASSKIKYAYKKYFHLKSAALENSLSLCDFEVNDRNSPEHAQQFDGLTMEYLSPESESLPTLPSGPEVEKLLSNAHNVETKSTSPFTDTVSKKLFKNRRFSMRNPRKLPQLKSQTSSNSSLKENDTIEIEQKEEILDTFASETDNLTDQPSHGDTVFGNISNLLDKKNNIALRQFNKSWLQRATGLPLESDDTKIKESSFGLSNVKFKSNLEGKVAEYVENSESDEEDVAINKIIPALKKRKITSIPQIDFDRHNDSIVENNQRATEHASSCTSSSNEIKNKTNKCKSSRRKTKLTTSTIHESDEKPPDIAEYMPFKLETDITPSYIKVTDLMETLSSSSKHVTEKESEGNNKFYEKIKNGTLNENFIKINIEKKKFARHHKGINYSRYKKQQWKDKKALHAGMEFPESGKIKCFKCEGTGHMARYCTAHKGDNLLPMESYNQNDIPTLEDMETIVSEDQKNNALSETWSHIAHQSSQIPESFLKMLAENKNDDGKVNPVFTNYPQEAPQEVLDALKLFGHKGFRPGQEQAVLRILCGMSTLLILSTGSGKSLCYQLPAYIYAKHYKCITLVISPLVSLMEDQVFGMPEFLKAGCLHANQAPTVRSKIIKCLKDGEINILLISPEALISGESSNSFMGLFKSFPQIAFACIDEAHCVSQWSHNFRPSYLMLCRVLKEKLGVKCILGLTATASQATVKSIIDHIDVPDGQKGVIKSPTLPDNLHLSVSFEKDKDKALVSYLLSERVCNFNSIIVYCIRRDECERVAAILRSCLQEPGKVNMEKKTNKRKRMSYISEAYHAGMSAAQRKKIQKHFMDGSLKIIVATVAFGMGINKSDIRCIIHYNMPSSFESYVQEVGRAGRDGDAAFCHVFMSHDNKDKWELLKHIHANTIDRPTIRKLLQKVFIPCKCLVEDEKKGHIRCRGHETGIPIDKTVEELDLPSENIATLLCYIELHEKKYINILSNAYTVCKISSYGGPQKLLEATKTCPPLAMAYLMQSKVDSDATKHSYIEFPVIDVAAAVGWESGIAKYHLKNLEWITDNGVSKRSQIKVEFNTLGFRIKTPGDLSSTELDQILDDLHEIVMTQEKTAIYQLEECLKAFLKIGNNSFIECYQSEEVLQQKSNELKSFIRDYFERDTNLPKNVTLEKHPVDQDRVISDVRALICSYKDCSFTGRSIAKIFQGIHSPNFPAIVWGRCKFWRSHIHEDFYSLMKIATEQIIYLKVK